MWLCPQIYTRRREVNNDQIIGIDFNDKKYVIVEKVAKTMLESLKASNAKKGKKSDAIYEEACKKYPEMKETISLDVFKSYLSSISRKQDSEITREIGKHGYYLKEPPSEEELASSEIETGIIDVKKEPEKLIERVEREQERKSNEKKLYPILTNWLQEQEFRTKDTSSMRTMDRWSNPDITGIRVEENLHSYEIEIATIEAKVTNDNFQYDIFEAVSHRRFSNRAYFAFAGPTEMMRKPDHELRYYSELYNVGVLLVAMDQSLFNEFKAGKVAELDPDDIDIYEIYSSLYETKQNRWQKDFLKALSIVESGQLWTWGETLK